MTNDILESVSREQALFRLWQRRGEFEKEDKLEEFEQIENKIKQVPVLTVTLAVDFEGEELSMLVKKIRETFKREVFVDFRVDRSLVGGCLFIFGGRVFDFSILKKIKDKGSEVRDVIRNSLQ